MKVDKVNATKITKKLFSSRFLDQLKFSKKTFEESDNTFK